MVVASSFMWVFFQSSLSFMFHFFHFSCYVFVFVFFTSGGSTALGFRWQCTKSCDIIVVCYLLLNLIHDCKFEPIIISPSRPCNLR